MHRLITDNRAAISELCRRYDVKKLEVVGSAARGGDFDERLSDADFLVEFQRTGRLGPLEEFFGLREELAALLGRSVDLVESGAIRNPYVLSNINQARELVYGA
jgi:predicted nucleotidyltransferase